MSAPLWDAEGEPVNLEAAAQDALEWLRVLRRYVRRDIDEEQRILGAIAALERFLPTVAATPTEDES